MTDFFRGWRRKAGVLTLAMACAFATWWMRSLITDDFIALPFDVRSGDWHILALATEQQSLALYAMNTAGQEVSFPSFVPLLKMPFYWIVIPLTLLSAWLLLSKPRKPIVPRDTSASIAT